jgi:hypothetical protein
MRDRIATLGPIAAVASVVGLCCGLPVVLSTGIAGAVAGWSLQSWTLSGLGLVLAALGWARWARGRHEHASHCAMSATPVAAPPVPIADSADDWTANVKTDHTAGRIQP